MKFACTRKSGEKRVWIRIEVDGDSTDYVWLYRDFESAAVAKTMRDAIDEGAYLRIKEIRRKAYEAGKKAARGRGPKITDFSGCINSDWVGY